MAYSYKITKVDDLKKRIDFRFTVFVDGLEIGRDVVQLYAENFFNLSVEDRLAFVNKAVVDQCKKFQAAKDVWQGEEAFTKLLGVEVPLADVAYPPVVPI